MSNVKQIKGNHFSKTTCTDWKVEAEKALRGKPVEMLASDTYEGIQRRPVYTEADLQQIKSDSAMPGRFPFIRGTRSVDDKKANWMASQQLYPHHTWEDLNEQLHQELAAGLEAIHLSAYPAADPLSLHLEGSGDLEALLQGIPIGAIPVQVYAGKSVSHFISLIKNSKLPYKKIKGIIGADPIGELVQTGFLTESMNDVYEEMLHALQWKKENMPDVKTIWIQGKVYHNSGANAVEELAASMAAGAAYLEALIEREVSINEAAEEIAFSFSIGSDLFMEMAKLRAARLLWANIIDAFGGDDSAQKIMIHAATSQYNKSSLDPYVNMLRTTTEAFSAVVGGADSIHIDSFNLSPDRFPRRISRNTHYILREESLLSQVVDPAAGSYYVETLTQQLAEKAWALFQKIDGHGGIIESLKNNFIQEKITGTRKKRKKDIETRKRVMVGTNMYANLAEEFVCAGFPAPAADQEAALTITPLKPMKLSEPFERLREQAKKYEERTSIKPTVTIVNLGKLASHKPRTDFASGFFHAGGLYVNSSPSLLSSSELRDWSSSQMTTKYVCICGSDESYTDMLEEAILFLKQMKPEVKVVIAGLPDEERREALKDLGVMDYIHMKSNCLQQLLAIHHEMGLIQNEA